MGITLQVKQTKITILIELTSEANTEPRTRTARRMFEKTPSPDYAPRFLD